MIIRLETLDAAKRIQKMLSDNENITPEELDNAKKYLLSAVKCDIDLITLMAVEKELESGMCSIKNDIPENSTYDNFAKIKAGDKILVDLGSLGSFTATAYEVTDDDILFIFDDHIARCPMNSLKYNEGGYENSDLRKWIDIFLYDLFPQELKKRLVELTLPTVGQVVGWDDEWNKEHFETDCDEQLPLMKLRKNRVAYFNNECEYGWLRNAVKKEFSSASFACVGYYGYAYLYDASFSLGVRPAFRLKK